MDVTLADVRLQLRLTDGELTEDDPLISRLIAVAKEIAEKDLDKRLFITDAELEQSTVDNGMVISASIAQAIIMLASHLYQNPDLAGEAKLIETPMAYQHIIHIFKNHPVG